jgi:hypothetical protein
MPSFAKSKSPGRGKKKNTAARVTMAISKDKAQAQSPPPQMIAANTPTEFKVDVERELRNYTKQAAKSIST